jgi:hypothetical protein
VGLHCFIGGRIPHLSKKYCFSLSDLKERLLVADTPCNAECHGINSLPRLAVFPVKVSGMERRGATKPFGGGCQLRSGGTRSRFFLFKPRPLSSTLSVDAKRAGWSMNTSEQPHQ